MREIDLLFFGNRSDDIVTPFGIVSSGAGSLEAHPPTPMVIMATNPTTGCLIRLAPKMPDV